MDTSWSWYTTERSCTGNRIRSRCKPLSNGSLSQLFPEILQSIFQKKRISYLEIRHDHHSETTKKSQDQWDQVEIGNLLIRIADQGFNQLIPEIMGWHFDSFCKISPNINNEHRQTTRDVEQQREEAALGPMVSRSRNVWEHRLYVIVEHCHQISASWKHRFLQDL